MERQSARVTWLGHAGVRVEVAGSRALVDPLLTHRAGHLRRRWPVPSAAAYATDVVLVSHAHSDHLHRPSLRLVRAASGPVPVIVPAGAARYAERLGLGPVTEVRPGDTLEVAGFAITVTEAAHTPGRGRWDRATAVLGYVLERDGRRFHHAGDTDLYDAMDALGRLDLAAVPISGWWKRLGPGHLDAESAVEAVRRLDPVRVLPIHWGTYSPEDLRRWASWLPEPGTEFTEHLRRAGLLDRLIRLHPGETATW